MRREGKTFFPHTREYIFEASRGEERLIFIIIIAGYAVVSTCLSPAQFGVPRRNISDALFFSDARAMDNLSRQVANKRGSTEESTTASSNPRQG